MGDYDHQLDTDGAQSVTATLRQYQRIDADPSSSSIVFDHKIITSIYRRENDYSLIIYLHYTATINVTEYDNPFLRLREVGFGWNK